MSGVPPLPPSGIPGFVLDDTNLFNFGPELDAVARDVANILANQNAFFAEVQTSQAQLIASANAAIANLNTTLANLAQLLQVAILGLQQVASSSTQQQILTLLQEIYELLAPLRPSTIGLDPAATATVSQKTPSKPGP